MKRLRVDYVGVVTALAVVVTCYIIAGKMTGGGLTGRQNDVLGERVKVWQ